METTTTDVEGRGGGRLGTVVMIKVDKSLKEDGIRMSSETVMMKLDSCSKLENDESSREGIALNVETGREAVSMVDVIGPNDETMSMMVLGTRVLGVNVPSVTEPVVDMKISNGEEDMVSTNVESTRVGVRVGSETLIDEELVSKSITEVEGKIDTPVDDDGVEVNVGVLSIITTEVWEVTNKSEMVIVSVADDEIVSVIVVEVVMSALEKAAEGIGVVRGKLVGKKEVVSIRETEDNLEPEGDGSSDGVLVNGGTTKVAVGMGILKVGAGEGSGVGLVLVGSDGLGVGSIDEVTLVVNDSLNVNTLLLKGGTSVDIYGSSMLSLMLLMLMLLERTVVCEVRVGAMEAGELASCETDGEKDGDVWLMTLVELVTENGSIKVEGVSVGLTIDKLSSTSLLLNGNTGLVDIGMKIPLVVRLGDAATEVVEGIVNTSMLLDMGRSMAELDEENIISKLLIEVKGVSMAGVVMERGRRDNEGD